MIDFETMTKEDLQAELDKAQAALEDIQEERQFTLGQTGIHLGVSRAAALREQWAREESAIIAKIAAIRKLLQAG